MKRVFDTTRRTGAALLAAILALTIAPAQLAPAQEPLPDSARQLEASKQKGSGFPDFGFMVSPAEYAAKYSDQPIFRLKTDFPSALPAHIPEFMDKIDFRTQPLAYLEAVRDYAFEGNLPTWDPFKNHVREWYHIPWLHPTTTGPNAYPPNGGTEGFHGLIKEAPLSALQLGPGQKGSDYSVYAITLINDFAGYTMGRMWHDPQHPDPRTTDSRYGGGFPVGTVFAKLLFTDAPMGTDHLAFMENPLSWLAYITPTFFPSGTGPVTRIVRKVNLLQMDIAVRDARADGPGLTGWVFGTFVYNGQLNNANKFMNLVPAGLTWGNDPENRTNKTNPFPPVKTQVNKDLKQSVIFDTPRLPPQHLGWNGRLNGPADLNTTSCMSCHITAQYPAVTSLVPDGAVPDGGLTPPVQGGTDEWMKWFANIRCATSMNPRSYSTDFSFQVAIALQNFFTVESQLLQGDWASDYGLSPKPIARGLLRKPPAARPSNLAK